MTTNTTAIATTPAPTAQGPFTAVTVTDEKGNQEQRFTVNDPSRAYTKYSIFIREGNMPLTIMAPRNGRLIEWPAKTAYKDAYGKPAVAGTPKKGPYGIYRMYIPLTGVPGKVGLWRTMTEDEKKQAKITD